VVAFFVLGDLLLDFLFIEKFKEEEFNMFTALSLFALYD